MPTGVYDRQVKTIIPNEGVFHFEATVRKEGKANKYGYRITIPNPIVRGLEHLGWDLTWIDLRLNNHRCIVHARLNTETNVAISIPQWLRPDIERDSIIQVNVRDPKHQRAIPGTPISFRGIDLTAFAPKETFITDEPEGMIAVHNKWSPPFVVQRLLSSEQAFWLLGFYQAEGSKSKTAVDWSIAQKNKNLIKHASQALVSIGVPLECQYLEALHGPNSSNAEARHIYSEVGPVITAARQRPGKGEEAAVLHARNSKNFMRMTVQVLDELVNKSGLEKLSREQNRGYAIGFIEGDGCIVFNCSVELRTSGYQNELEACDRALIAAFNWENRARVFRNIDDGITRSLTIEEMIDLGINGAFVGTSNRARLILGLEKRFKTAVKNDAVSPQLYERIAPLEHEIKETRRLAPPGSMGLTGKKGT